MKGAQSRTGHFATAFLLCVAACALAACGGSASASGPQATVPVTTIASSASYAIPRQITAPYVQRVLNALNAVDGDATRLIVAHRSLIKPAVYRLQAIDADSWFTEVTSTWADDLASGLQNYRSVPGNQRDTVQKIISASPSCVYVQAVSDFRASTVTPEPPHVNYIELVRLPPGRDKGGWNTTPWMIGVEGWNSQGLMPSDPCTSASQ
jgi:hypothetical protein